jgi:hypothetical protein
VTSSSLSDNSHPVAQHPARLVIAVSVLALTGAAFCVAAVNLICGTLVNAPAVAQLFATVAAVLLAVAVLHFVVVRGIWAHRAWAALLGILISFAATFVSGYIWFDQLTHSDDALRVSAPYFVTALLYAVCLVLLVTSVASFRKN